MSVPVTPPTPIATPTPTATSSNGSTRPIDWDVVRAIVGKDLTAVRRAKAVLLPMLVVPAFLLIVVPLILTLVAVHTHPDVSAALRSLPGPMRHAIKRLPGDEQPVMLIDLIFANDAAGY